MQGLSWQGVQKVVPPGTARHFYQLCTRLLMNFSRLFGLLRGVSLFETDASKLPIGLIFKGQALQVVITQKTEEFRSTLAEAYDVARSVFSNCRNHAFFFRLLLFFFVRCVVLVILNKMKFCVLQVMYRNRTLLGSRNQVLFFNTCAVCVLTRPPFLSWFENDIYI
jgi:hypothetical protein